MLAETRTPSTDRFSRGLALAVALAALLAANPAQAARKKELGTVNGLVTSMASGEALAGVEVTLTGAGGEPATARTDRKGKFSLKVPAGDYILGLTAEGHAPLEVRLTVQAGGSQRVEVEMLDAAAGRRSEAAKLYNAGVGALKAGDMAAAKESLLAAAEADPTLSEPHRLLARVYYDEGAWADAARAAEAFVAANPDDMESLRLAYDAYRRLGDPRAVELRRSLAADPELRKSLAVHAFNEGARADQDGDTEVAASRFREAVELDAGLAVAHFALASHDYRAKRFDEALAAARRGLEIEPASVQGRRLVFISLDAKGSDEAATEALDAYAEVDVAGAVEILYQRAEADFLNGDREPARRFLGKILEYQPDHAHAYRLLGLLDASTDVSRAKRHLQRFLELAPDDPEAPTVREILAAL